MNLSKAMVLSFVERYLLVVLSLASNMLLARLLSPEDIGIYSVSLAVISIAHVLREFGIGDYLIQEKALDESHIRTAFGMSLALGTTLFLVVHFGAQFVGQYFGEPRMVGALKIVALNFLVLPFCSIPMALLKRAMAFDKMLVISVLSNVAGLGTTALLALRGYGADSMAIGSVVGNLATALGMWLVWRPSAIVLPSLGRWREMLSYSSKRTAATLVSDLSYSANDLAVGRILGFAPVAILSRAQGLVSMFQRDAIGAVRNVAFPAFAQAHREGRDLEAGHTAMVTNVTAVAWTFYGFIALFPLEIMRIMFGRQWDACANLVPLFALSGAIAALSCVVLNAILATGRVDLVMTIEIVLEPARAMLIIVALLVFGSLTACAIAHVVFWSIYVPVAFVVKGRCIPNDLRNLAANLLRSLKVAVASLLLPACISLLASPSDQTARSLGLLIAAAVVTAIGWVMAIRLFRHPIAEIAMLRRLLLLRRNPA
jgi:O-antigen/teichoic acid export membrane protein